MSDIPKPILELLRLFPSLKSAQIDTCRERVKTRIQNRLGEEPQRDDFVRRVGRKPDESQYFTKRDGWFAGTRQAWSEWTHTAGPLDLAIIPILGFLLAISLSHMLVWSGIIADASYHAAPEDFQGIWLSVTVWMYIHQIGMFGLSEIGVLFFFSRHSLVLKQKEAKGEETPARGKRFANLNFALAVSFALIVVFANVVSLMAGAVREDGSLDIMATIFAFVIGILVPVTTLYLGDRIAELTLDYILARQAKESAYTADLTEWKKRKESLETEFSQARTNWYALQDNPAMYDEQDGVNSYQRYLAQAIVEYYKKYRIKLKDDTYTPNFSKWTPEFEKWLAGRELAKIASLGDLDSAINFFESAARVKST